MITGYTDGLKPHQMNEFMDELGIQQIGIVHLENLRFERVEVHISTDFDAYEYLDGLFCQNMLKNKSIVQMNSASRISWLGNKKF
jgi:hypothetical protein